MQTVFTHFSPNNTLSSKDLFAGIKRDTDIKSLQVCKAVPPSVVRSWCAHFAEVTVKAHHMEILDKTLQPSDAFVLPPSLISRRESFIEKHGSSSPHLRWEKINDQEDVSSEKPIPGPSITDDFLRHIESKDVLAVHDLITHLNAKWPHPSTMAPWDDESDPSSYLPMSTAWEIIMRADQSMRHTFLKCHGATNPIFSSLADATVARAISSISEAGAPSWGSALTYGAVRDFWPEIFPAACTTVLDALEVEEPGYVAWVSMYARLNILRAAYYTVMMRAAHEIGPGLTEETRIETALAYMA